MLILVLFYIGGEGFSTLVLLLPFGDYAFMSYNLKDLDNSGFNITVFINNILIEESTRPYLEGTPLHTWIAKYDID